MLLAMLVAAAVSFASTPMVKTLACKVGAIDVPKDNRRMHKVPIPRMGGLAIFLAFLLSVLVFADIDRQMQGILLGSIMIVILGVLDDIMALKALPKLFVQIAAAGVAVWHGCRIQFISNPNVFSEATYLNLGWLTIPVTIIWIVAITNAVNSGFSAAELSRANQQAALMQQLFAMQMQQANCCCETREAIQGVNYNLATQACDTRNQMQQGFCAIQFQSTPLT